jgi:hypothetical protein
MSELTFCYEITHEHRVRSNPITFPAICCRHPLGQAGWAKLYRDHGVDYGTAGAEACRAPWTAVVCNPAALE